MISIGRMIYSMTLTRGRGIRDCRAGKRTSAVCSAESIAERSIRSTTAVRSLLLLGKV
jgi:hypothetical protein